MKLYYLVIFIAIFSVPACKDDNSSSSNVYDPIEKPAQDNHDTGTNPDPFLPNGGEPNRDAWQKPDMVIGLLENLSDKTVADIGAGAGYFSFRLARVAKKVIAIEIDQQMIAFMDSIKVQMPEDIQSRFEARLAEEDDPHLKPGEADYVIMVNTYAYINNRIRYFKNLRKGLAKGGKIAVIDFKDKYTPVSPPDDLIVLMSTVERELKAAGFKDVRTNDTSLEYQYIVIATN